MTITAVRGLVSEQYTPEQAGDKENKTSFEIKPLNGLVALEVLADGKTDADGTFRVTGQALQKALKHGLVGWKNFTDEVGNDIKFSITNFHRVPAMVLNDIASEIINRSQLSGDEVKNS